MFISPNPTDTELAAFLGGFLGAISIFLIIFYVLLIIAGWKILKKAGEPGWKILIPIYNAYMLLKIVGMKKWFWALLLVSVVCSIFYGVYGSDPNGKTVYIIVSALQMIFTLAFDIIYSYRMSKAFHHGVGFAVGLFFLPNIFWLILGFGKSKYDKKILKTNN